MSYYDSEDQGHEYDDEALDIRIWLNPNPQRFWFTDNLLYHRKERKKNMSDFTTVFSSGTIYWAKVLGKPVLNYEGDAREWTYQFVPDDVSFLKQHGLLDRLKEDKKGIIEGDFLNLKKPELDSKGEANDPIRIYDADNKPWDTNKLIGNGSKVDVKLTIADWGKGKKKSIWTSAIRVTEHVPYESNEFGGMDSNEPASSKKTRSKASSTKEAASQELDDLDDDVPF